MMPFNSLVLSLILALGASNAFAIGSLASRADTIQAARGLLQEQLEKRNMSLVAESVELCSAGEPGGAARSAGELLDWLKNTLAFGAKKDDEICFAAIDMKGAHFVGWSGLMTRENGVFDLTMRTFQRVVSTRWVTDGERKIQVSLVDSTSEDPSEGEGADALRMHLKPVEADAVELASQDVPVTERIRAPVGMERKLAQKLFGRRTQLARR